MNWRWRTPILAATVLSILCTLGGCSGEAGGGAESVVLKVNGYSMTLAEFEDKLASDHRMSEDYKKSAEGRREYLETLVEKELLIQAAIAMQLDRKEKFVATIERHWETTLVNQLRAVKEQELSRQGYPKPADARRYYEKMKEQHPELPSFAAVQDRISKDMRQGEVQKLLDRMVADANVHRFAGGDAAASDIYVQINDYTLTLEEFERKMVAELQPNDGNPITAGERKVYVQGLIRREVLIQEARRQQLDRSETFVNAIRIYWEATLVSNLIELKGKELSQACYVTAEEVRTRYAQIKLEDPDLPPVEEMTDTISRALFSEKIEQKQKAWIEDLRKKADITKNETLLDDGGLSARE